MIMQSRPFNYQSKRIMLFWPKNDAINGKVARVRTLLCVSGLYRFLRRSPESFGQVPSSPALRTTLVQQMKRHPVFISNQHFLYFRQAIEVELTDSREEEFIDLRQDFECCFLYHRLRLP